MSNPDKQSVALPKSLSELVVGEVYPDSLLEELAENQDFTFTWIDSTAVVLTSAASNSEGVWGNIASKIYDRRKEGE